VWLGVTVEDAKYKYRIPVLQGINAFVRFISFEPLIGSVGNLDLSGIQWAIIGGESGKKARPMKVQWVEEIFEQCKKQGVSFFFKQWGTYGSDEIKRSKKRNGRLFLNQEWNEYPVLSQ
jgi:protein gp37